MENVNSTLIQKDIIIFSSYNVVVRLTFEFTPVWLAMMHTDAMSLTWAKSSRDSNTSAVCLLVASSDAWMYGGLCNGDSTRAKFNNNTYSWYRTSERNQFNTKNFTYYWIAF